MRLVPLIQVLSPFCCDLFDSKFQGLYYDNSFSLAIVVSSPVCISPYNTKADVPRSFKFSELSAPVRFYDVWNKSHKKTHI